MDDGPSRSRPAAVEAPDGQDQAPAWRPAWGYLVLAAGILGGALAWSLTGTPAPAPARIAAASVPVPAALPPATPDRSPAPAAAGGLVAAPTSAVPSSAARTPVAPQIPRLRDPGGDQTPDIADFVNPGERPTMPEVIERLRQAGVTGGLAAFPPPGTRPPRIGLAVPEDFVLPEGYVRHHQSTDDGQSIEAILMFSPDHAFFDAAGRPVQVPPDRVVPPELAPPGLPLRRIVVPPPTDAGRPGR